MIVSRVVATLRVYGILIDSQTCICSSLMASNVWFAVLCFLTSPVHSGLFILVGRPSRGLDKVK